MLGTPGDFSRGASSLGSKFSQAPWIQVQPFNLKQWAGCYWESTGSLIAWRAQRRGEAYGIWVLPDWKSSWAGFWGIVFMDSGFPCVFQTLLKLWELLHWSDHNWLVQDRTSNHCLICSHGAQQSQWSCLSGLSNTICCVKWHCKSHTTHPRKHHTTSPNTTMRSWKLTHTSHSSPRTGNDVPASQWGETLSLHMSTPFLHPDYSTAHPCRKPLLQSGVWKKDTNLDNTVVLLLHQEDKQLRSMVKAPVSTLLPSVSREQDWMPHTQFLSNKTSCTAMQYAIISCFY